MPKIGAEQPANRRSIPGMAKKMVCIPKSSIPVPRPSQPQSVKPGCEAHLLSGVEVTKE